jgi:ATPase family associated with various cellular activities (AAA)
MAGGLPDPGAFGAAFEDFIQAMSQAATRPESPLAARLRAHLDADPSALPSTVVELATTDHPNLQLALDAVLPDAEIVGYSTRHSAFGGIGLADIISGMSMAGPIRPAPVQRVAVEVGDGRVVRCVTMGMYLGHREGTPVALVLSRGERPWGGTALKVEGVSPDADAVPQLLADLRAAMREHNVYRGKVISLHQHEDRAVSVQFHHLPEIARDAVILPDGTLERLERQAIGVAHQADRLRAAGRHLKRGVLLHGPPGTGKTLSVTYLLGAMPGRTSVLLTGRGLGLIEQAVGSARELAPATVVFEDVDLVAGERTMDYGAGGGILFELLNQMEGLEDDADLLFVLTTNRPDLIEPALAARPGRVDLALEIPLPDADARRRLIRLYAGDIELGQAAEDDLVTRTESVSGAFIKELMRQATLRAALEDHPATAADVITALDDLLDERAALTRRLLGQPADGAAPDTPISPTFAPMVHALGAAGLPLPPDVIIE